MGAEGFDCGEALQGYGDFVGAAQQHVTVEAADFEMVGLAGGGAHCAILQIDHQCRLRRDGLEVRDQAFELGDRQADGEEAVADAIVAEDGAVTFRDDASDAELPERPDRGLSRRAAPEIAAADEDLGAVERRAVEDEIWVGVVGAARSVAPVGEKFFAVAGADDRLGFAGRNDSVGIDIVYWQDCRDGGQAIEDFHLGLQ